jgi:hypothetical protein
LKDATSAKPNIMNFFVVRKSSSIVAKPAIIRAAGIQGTTHVVSSVWSFSTHFICISYYGM